VGSLTKDMLPQVVHMLSVVWALLQRIPPVAWVAGVLRPAVQLAVQYRGVLGRLAATVGLLAVIRCGLYIPLPGVDFSRMPATGLMSEGTMTPGSGQPASSCAACCGSAAGLVHLGSADQRSTVAGDMSTSWLQSCFCMGHDMATGKYPTNPFSSLQ
jgi:hypothetical protein